MESKPARCGRVKEELLCAYCGCEDPAFACPCEFPLPVVCDCHWEVHAKDGEHYPMRVELAQDLKDEGRYQEFVERVEVVKRNTKSALSSLRAFDSLHHILQTHNPRSAALCSLQRRRAAAAACLESARMDIYQHCTGLDYRPAHPLAAALFAGSEKANTLARLQLHGRLSATLYTRVDEEGNYSQDLTTVEYTLSEMAESEQTSDQVEQCLEQFATAVNALGSVVQQCVSTGKWDVSNTAESLSAQCEGVSERISSIVHRAMADIATAAVPKRKHPVAIKRAKTESTPVVEILSDSEPCPSSHELPTIDPSLCLIVPKTQSLEILDCLTETWFEVSLQGKIAVRSATALYLSTALKLFIYCQLDITVVNLPDGKVDKRRLTNGKVYPGIIADDEQLYVFCGERSQSCQRFSVDSFISTPLSNALSSHSHFQPCFHGSDILLCGGRSKVCEKYQPQSDLFTDLSISFPANIASFATVIDGFLHVIATSQRSDTQTFYWKSEVGDDINFSVTPRIADETWGTAVRIVGSTAYFLVNDTVHRFNLLNTAEESTQIPSLY